jgi:hypothetical protein
MKLKPSSTTGVVQLGFIPNNEYLRQQTILDSMKKQGRNLRSFNIEEEELEEDEIVETLPRNIGHVHDTMVTEVSA